MTRNSFSTLVLAILGLNFFTALGFSQTRPDFLGFDSLALDYQFNRADREIDPGRWMEEAKEGIAIARALWEEMIPELRKDPALFEEAEENFARWSGEELERRFTRWLLSRFLGVGPESLALVSKETESAGKGLLYRTGGSGEIIYDEKTGDPELIRPGDEDHVFESDLAAWRRRAGDSAKAGLNGFEIRIEGFFPELLMYVPPDKREEFSRKISGLSETAVNSLRAEFSGMIAREERFFTAHRLGDVYSLRKKSEDESAASVEARLIEETGRSLSEGLEALKAKIEAADAGAGDLGLEGSEWLSQYREQFERGLKAWEEAEERFFIRRIEWEQEAGFRYQEGEDAWNKAFNQYEEARRDWEIKTEELFRSGEALFVSASQNLEKAVREAKAEFERDAELRSETGAGRAKAWADMYSASCSTVAQARENIDFWIDRYSMELRQTGSPDSPAAPSKEELTDGTFKTWLEEQNSLWENKNNKDADAILEELKNWSEIYASYYNNALEARDALFNEFSLIMGAGKLAEILNEGTSSEDFYLDEYQIELLRAKSVVEYWERKVKIAEAVVSYARDLTSGRTTDAEGVRAWEKAKADYEEAVSEYEAFMEKLMAAGEETAESRNMLNEIAVKMKKSEARLEELNDNYNMFQAAEDAQRETYLLENLLSKTEELKKETELLNNWDAGGVRSRYLKALVELGEAQETERKGILLGELINGNDNIGPSLVELAKTAAEINSLYENDAAAGFPGEDLSGKLDAEAAFMARDLAELELETRLLMVKLIACDSIADAGNLLGAESEEHLRKNWESASLKLLEARAALELGALERIYDASGSLQADDEITLLAGSAAIDEGSIAAAAAVLKTMLSLIGENSEKPFADVLDVLDNAAKNDIPMRFFLSGDSFFGSTGGYHISEVLLRNIYFEKERSERILYAYQVLEFESQGIAKNEFGKRLEKISGYYESHGIDTENGLIPNCESFVRSMLLEEDDAVGFCAEYLNYLNDIIECLPAWAAVEFESWKETFINYFVQELIKSEKAPVESAEEVIAEMESIENLIDLLNQSGETNAVKTMNTFEELNNKLKYAVNKYNVLVSLDNAKTNAGNFGNSIEEMTRAASEINSFYKLYAEQNENPESLAYRPADKYIQDPYLEWNDADITTTKNIFYENYYSASEALQGHLYKEYYLKGEIEKIKAAISVLKGGTSAAKDKKDEILREIENEKMNFSLLSLDYQNEARRFDDAGTVYDSLYRESKAVCEFAEKKRFEYEIQDAVRRWAETAYTDPGIPADELIYAAGCLGRAEQAMAVIKELYDNDEQRRPYESGGYNDLYNKYKESFEKLFTSLNAEQILRETIDAEKQANETAYNNYVKQIKDLSGAGDLADPYNNADSGISRMLSLLTIDDDGRLRFARDGNFKITAPKDSTVLEDYFRQEQTEYPYANSLSQYELSLADLNKRLENYNLTRNKYEQWGMARDYLVRNILAANGALLNGFSWYNTAVGLNSDKNLGKKYLIPISNLRIEVYKEAEIYRFFLPYLQEQAWNSLNENEKNDLEYYTILALLGGGYQESSYFDRISEYNEYKYVYDQAYDQYKTLKRRASLLFVGIFYKTPYKIIKNTKESLGAVYSELNDNINKTLRGLNENIKLTDAYLDEYAASSERLRILTEREDGGKLDWNDIKTALLMTEKTGDAELEQVEKLWLEMSEETGETWENVPEALQYMVAWSRGNVKDYQGALDTLWRNDEAERLEAERIYRDKNNLYIEGIYDSESLMDDAYGAYGNMSPAQKNHFEKTAAALMENVSGFVEKEGKFQDDYNNLVIDFTDVIKKAYIARYEKELNAREAEWEQKRLDIQDKYKEWEQSAARILENGRKDWQDNNIKLRDAYERWLVNFKEEYDRTNAAWTAAYMEGLENKDNWLKRAEAVVLDSAADALIGLLGAEAESKARILDMRDPGYFIYAGGAGEAEETLEKLLENAGTRKPEMILGLAEKSAGTISTVLRRGLEGSRIWNAGITAGEASKFARAAEESIATRESARLAVNIRDMTTNFLKEIEVSIRNANSGFRKQMDDTFIMGGQWRRSGKDYIKEAIVHSTIIKPVITETTRVEGFREYLMPQIYLSSAVNADQLNNINAPAIQVLIDNIFAEVAEVYENIFGQETGDFYIYLGKQPTLKSQPNPEKGRQEVFSDYGNGEIGRLMTEFFYWYIKEANGLAALAIAPWDKPLWDSRDSWFDAPSIRQVCNIGLQAVTMIAAAATAIPSGGSSIIGAIAMGTAINSADDLVFNTFDALGGYKTWTEAGVSFGKAALANTISAATNVVFSGAGGASSEFLKNGLTKSVVNKAVNSAGAAVMQTAMTGVQVFTTSSLTGMVSGVNYSSDGGWSYSGEYFKETFKNAGKAVLTSMTGTAASSILNSGNIGFTGKMFNDGEKLNNLAGGLAGQGVNYALGGDFTLNLLNLDFFTKNTDTDMGLLEMRLGGGIGMNFGTGGVNIGPGVFYSALDGLETWGVNTRLLFSGQEESKAYASQLRTLYSGSETNKVEYRNILAGKTDVVEGNNNFTQSVYDPQTDVKTIYLGKDAVNDGSRFGLNVMFSHESYRDGVTGSLSGQEEETARAVYGHAATALALLKTYGLGSLDLYMTLESMVIETAKGTPDTNLVNSILDSYDDSADYWKLVRNEEGKWEWIDDKSADFDIGELITDSRMGSLWTPAGGAVFGAMGDSVTKDGKYFGTISAGRMNENLIKSLGDVFFPVTKNNDGTIAFLAALSPEQAMDPVRRYLFESNIRSLVQYNTEHTVTVYDSKGRPTTLHNIDLQNETRNQLFKQTDPSFGNIPDLMQSGCNFLDIISVPQFLTKTALTSNQILDLWNLAAAEGIIDSDGFVKDANKLGALALDKMNISSFGISFNDNYKNQGTLIGYRKDMTWDTNRRHFVLSGVSKQTVYNSAVSDDKPAIYKEIYVYGK
jgi:hypothetical protein